VERWVAEQNVTGDPGQYSQDTWYVLYRPSSYAPIWPRYACLARVGECPDLGRGSSCPIGGPTVAFALSRLLAILLPRPALLLNWTLQSWPATYYHLTGFHDLPTPHTLLTVSSPICLSSMSSSSYLANPKPAHLAGQRGPPPSRSDGSCSCGATDYRRDSGIIVLNRCHHAFHLACLTSWFEYRRYRCPICQASYSPTKAAQR